MFVILLQMPDNKKQLNNTKMSDQELIKEITGEDIKSFINHARNGRREKRKQVWLTILLGIFTPLVVIIIVWGFNSYTQDEVRKNEEIHIQKEIERKFSEQKEYSTKNLNAIGNNTNSIDNLVEVIDEKFVIEDKRYEDLKDIIYLENQKLRVEMNDGFLSLQQLILEQNGRKSQETTSQSSGKSSRLGSDTEFRE